MTDAAPELSEEPARELDSKLKAEASLYQVDYPAYAALTPKERAAIKMRWAKRIRLEAARRRVDADEFLAMTEEQRVEVRKEHPEHPVVLPRRKRTIDDVVASHPPPKAEVAPYLDEGLSRGDDGPGDEDEGTYSPAAAVPATEGNPEKRDKPTIGEVKPTENQDLVGWVQPENLLDVYARYTIGDGQHFIRVERTEPKVYQTFACAGFLGELREPLTEEEFALAYGGRTYLLQVYGPDPKGRRDPINGGVLIKPKTDKFKFTIPVLAPNLRALPGISARKGTGPMQPIHSIFGAQPTTAADAAIHKSTLDALSNNLDREQRRSFELQKQVEQKGAASADVLSVVAEQGKAVLEASDRAAQAREARLDGIITTLQQDNKALRERLDRLTEQPRESSIKDAAELLRVTSPGTNLEQQLQRQQATHTEEITRLKESHRDQIETLKSSQRDASDAQKTRHEEELKRVRERADQDEKTYRLRMEDLEKRMRDREHELKEQMAELRREEIARADQRVKDTEKMFEGRISDLKERHATELRMQSEQHQTRVDTSKSTFEMQLSNYKEREKRLQEELAEAKEEAASAGDPVQIVEKQKELAEKLGYKKEDDGAPQTAGERFAALAGMGVGKALETIGDWGPEIARAVAGRQDRPAMGGAPGAGQLPPGPGMRAPGRPAPGAQPRQNRVVAWATQNSPPMADHRPTMPPEPVVAEQAAPQPAPQAAPAAQTTPAPEAAPPPPATQSAPENGQSPNRLSKHFPDEMIAQFRHEVERAVNAGMPAEEFARRFLALDAQAAMVMVTEHKSEEFIETVRAMTGAGESAILRPDGKKWVQGLWREVPAQYKKAVEAAQAAQAAAPTEGQPS